MRIAARREARGPPHCTRKASPRSLVLTANRAFVSLVECGANHRENEGIKSPVLADRRAVRDTAGRLADGRQFRWYSRIPPALPALCLELAVAWRGELGAASLGHDLGDRRRLPDGRCRRRGAGRRHRLVAAACQCAGAVPGVREYAS